MKLALEITSAVKPEPTGIGRYVVGLVRAMLLLLGPEDRVILTYRLSRWGRREHAPDFQDPRTSTCPIQSPLAFLSVGFLDVYHGLGVNIPLGLSARAKFVTLHGLMPMYSSLAERNEKVQRRRAKIAKMLSRADRAFVVSEFEKARTVQLLDCDPEKLVVTYHGVDRERFFPSADPQTDRLALGSRAPARPFLLYLGAITELKNVGGLLKAYANSKAKNDFDLVLAGPPRRGSDSILAEIPRLGIAERVHALGHVSSDEVPNWLRASRALIHPSKYEAAGLPILEALACGTPVACSEVGALPEMAAGAAEHFSPDDMDSMVRAIDRIALDEGRRASLREKGLERSAAFDWKHCAQKTLDSYRSMLDRRI